MPVAPITPINNHNPGYYPDTVRHVSNGDPANQEFIGYPTRDLEYRTEVLREAHNTLVTDWGAELNSLENFDTTHDHNGGMGEAVLDLQKIYSNTNVNNASITLASGKKLVVKYSNSDPFFTLDEAGTSNKTKTIFPGSVDLFDHWIAPASDQVLRPHGLQMAARLYKITGSSGCLVAAAGFHVLTTPDVTPNFSLTTPRAALSTYVAGMIVEVGADSTMPQNIVSIVLHSTGAPVMNGADRVYGLLTYAASLWTVTFYSNGAPYSFGAPATLRFYGQYAYYLSTVSIVDPRVILAAKNGETSL